MCMYFGDLMSTPCSASLYFAFRLPWKPQNLRVRRLNRRRRLSKEEKRKEKMELKNLRLYRDNQSIIKENEKLRKKALLLHQENQVLLSQLQKLQVPLLFP